MPKTGARLPALPAALAANWHRDVLPQENTKDREKGVQAGKILELGSFLRRRRGGSVDVDDSWLHIPRGEFDGAVRVSRGQLDQIGARFVRCLPRFTRALQRFGITEDPGRELFASFQKFMAQVEPADSLWLLVEDRSGVGLKSFFIVAIRQGVEVRRLHLA